MIYRTLLPAAVVVLDLTDGAGVRGLFELVYRTGYRGFVPDFGRLTVMETDLLKALSLSFGVWGNWAPMQVIIGNRVIHLGSAAEIGYPKRFFTLPSTPRGA